MAMDFEKGELDRLEDFIILSSEGEQVRVKIELRKKPIKEKVHPDETDDMRNELDMYLLIGDYTFKWADTAAKKVSKVYVFGSMSESLVAASGNKNITNQRLMMDYQRLKDANIEFEEKYF